MRTRSSPHGREVLRVKKSWATGQAGRENGAQAGLGYVHINGTYKPIMNCHGVLVRGMKFDPWICDGFTITGFDVGPWEIGPYDIDTLIAGKVHIHYKIEYHNEGCQIPGLAKNVACHPFNERAPLR